MTKNLKNKSVLSSYQGAYDENVLVENFLSEGSADLMYHLQFFKEKLSSKKPGQQKKFDETFFEKIDNSGAEESALSVEQPADEAIQKKDTQPGWVKRLYRKIVMITHPDKTSGIQIREVKNKLNKQYLIVTESINSGTYANIVMVANQLDLDIPDEAINDWVEPALSSLKKRIVLNKTQIGYQWYFVRIDEKKNMLKSHLKAMGFIFTDEDVEAAIDRVRKNPRRKPGTKPVNRRRMRLK